MRKDIYITGVGVVSKFGHTMKDFWYHINEDWIQEKYHIKVDNQYKEVLADITNIEMHENSYEDYFFDMLIEAVISAVNDAKISLDTQKGCLIIGSGMLTADALLYINDVSDNFLSHVELKIKEYFNNKLDVIIIANACCAGSQAITYGYDLLQMDAYDFVIAGGVEAFSYITYCGFRRLNAIDLSGCKPFDKNRKGIYSGDGAAFFVLRKNDIYSYCKILGYSTTSDAFHTVAPRPDGSYIVRAIKQALGRSNLKEEDIDLIIAHGTGTSSNDSVEAKVLYDVFTDIDVTAPKGKIGHTGGASGAFGLLTGICTMKYQTIPSIVNLTEVDESMKVNVLREKKHKKISKMMIDCFAFGGTNTILVCGY